MHTTACPKNLGPELADSLCIWDCYFVIYSRPPAHVVIEGLMSRLDDKISFHSLYRKHLMCKGVEAAGEQED